MRVSTSYQNRAIPTIQMAHLQTESPIFREYVHHHSFFPFALLGTMDGMKTDDAHTIVHIPNTVDAANPFFLGLTVILVN